MTTAVAPERNFKTYPRGDLREEVLRTFRVHLRTLTNPSTGATFTEPEIAAATGRKSRFWIESEADDLVMLALQHNALILADQVREDKANTFYLENYHAKQWGLTRLPAEGGGGTINQFAVVGTIYPGSTTIPDATAYVMTAPDGKRFQNMFQTTATAGGAGGSDGAVLTLKGVDTGTETNLPALTVLTPADNIPPGGSGVTRTVSAFTGGVPVETDADLAKRVADEKKHKQGAGNRPQFRSWARKASGSIEDAFVYASALHAGSVIIAISQKRGTATGPDGRQPSAGTLATAIAYLTPPNSPVVPEHPHVLITSIEGFSTDALVSLSMPVQQDTGWADLTPWPNVSGSTASTLTGLTSQTVWKLVIPSGTAALPTGVTAPSMMAWNAVLSRFEKLQVQSVTLDAGLVYDVVLSSAPSFTLATGDIICPDTELRDDIAEAVEAYFDSRGPGQLIDLDTDPRAHRAFRFPPVEDEWPTRVGSDMLTYITDALGSVAGDATLENVVTSQPPQAVDPSSGPFRLTIADFGVYAL
jgi:hypothetical protein